MKEYILTQFEPYYLSEPIAQEELLKNSAWIVAKGIVVKEEITNQSEIQALYKNVRDKFMYFGVKPEYISQRRLFFAVQSNNNIPNSLVDADGNFIAVDWSTPLNKNLLTNHKDADGMGIKDRMEVFDKVVTRSVLEMYKDQDEQPDDIIHVSCSGYMAPNPVQKVSNIKRWYDTTVTNSYHMGCYAAVPAMRMAIGFLTASASMRQSPKTQVDIVHTELLSTHACSTDDSAESIIARTLFGDGLIRYSLKEKSALQSGTIALKPLTLDEMVLPDSLDDMTWKIKDHQFKMTLAISVPIHIQENITSFIEQLCQNIGIHYDDRAKDNWVFAIHPGGPKIVDTIAEKLNLRPDQVQYSKDVLYENGNMSSATIPTILKRILDDESVQPSQKIIAMAFGPGLTAAGGIFEKVIC